MTKSAKASDTGPAEQGAADSELLTLDGHSQRLSDSELDPPAVVLSQSRNAKHPAANRLPRQRRWAFTVVAAAMLAVASVLVFLLALANNNQNQLEQHYEHLLYLNIGVAAVFFLVMAWAVWRLVSRLLRGKFGSRLLFKLAAIFALVGFLPGVFIYTVSYQFVSRSIESWFNVKVEGALEAGLSLGRSTMDVLSSDLASKTLSAAQQLAESSNAGPLTLERLREQLGASEVVLWSAQGQMLVSAGTARTMVAPERPSSAQFRQARSSSVISQIEGLDEAAEKPSGYANVRIKAMALVNTSQHSFEISGGTGLAAEPRFLQVSQAIPSSLVTNALAVQEAYKEYQERSLARQGLRNMYLATLTLSLFLAMFGAVLLAATLGNQLVRPLLVLADGVAQVAAGDLRPKAALQTRDELGGLTRSFAQMTQQLFDARSQLQASLGDLDASRTHLQTILDNLTAAVVVLDPDGRMVQANPSATRILQSPLTAYFGQPLASVPTLHDFGQQVQRQFALFFNDQAAQADPQIANPSRGADHWQHSFELGAADQQQAVAGHEKTTNIIARGAALPGQLRLLVLDDITELASAQRSRAWGEVARRLAHEIKNPLTPIQLSAERLEMKLKGKLTELDEALLARSVKTIVDQVDAMKRLVNEFRDFARLPTAQLAPLDLNALVSDVLLLYAPDDAAVRIDTQLDPECPQILGDAQQLRQVIHNLLQNAQDACLTAASGLLADYSGREAQVHVLTRYNKQTARVRLTVTDTGTGFAPHILQRAFEPYVTTKSRGTGLGLAVVKKIVDEHGASIELSNLYPNDPTPTSTAPQAPVTKNNIPAIGARVSLSFAVV